MIRVVIDPASRPPSSAVVPRAPRDATGFLCAVLLLAAAARPCAAAGTDPLSLENCTAAALASNPGLKAARFRVEAARAAMQRAESAYYPRLSVHGDYTLTDNPPQAFMLRLNQRDLNFGDPAFDVNNPERTDNTRLSLQAGYLLYDAGRRGLQRDAANRHVRAAQAQVRAARSELVHEVTRAYYGAMQARAFVNVQRAAIAGIEESLRTARERLEAGSAVKTDVLNLDVQLAEAQEALIRARNRVELAIAALNTAIGEDLAAAAALPPPAPPGEVPPPPALVLEAGEARPELEAARHAAEAHLARHRATRRARLPRLQFFGHYDWDSAALSGFQDSYLAGLSAQWDLFTGFDNTASASETRALWQAARQEQRRVRNHVRLELRQAHLQCREAHERFEVLRKSVASAEEALRITRERYRQGASDLAELLLSQAGLTAMQTRHAAAFYGYRIALSNWRRAAGQPVTEAASSSTP
jgi:outer membrane protein TolC